MRDGARGCKRTEAMEKVAAGRNLKTGKEEEEEEEEEEEGGREGGEARPLVHEQLSDAIGNLSMNKLHQRRESDLAIATDSDHTRVLEAKS